MKIVNLTTEAQELKVLVITLIVGFILMTLTLGLALFESNQRIDSMERRIEYMTQYEDRKSGGTSLLTGSNIDYDLRTFDSGRTWYAVKMDSDWGMSILGEAEEVHPGLLDHIEAWDRLMEHVEQNGPIGLNDIQLLKDIGLEVTTK